MKTNFADTRRKVLITVVLLLIVIAVVVGYGWVRWSSLPNYWKANKSFKSSHSHQQLVNIADSAFNKWVSEFTAPIAGDSVDNISPNNLEKSAKVNSAPVTRTIYISISGANAWLDTRFKDWLSNQGIKLPKQISKPMVSVKGNNPIIAFKVNTKSIKQVVSIAFNLKFQSDGKISIQAASLRGGKLPLPLDVLIEKIHSYFPKHKNEINKLVKILHGKPFQPVIALDSRQIRLLDCKVDKNGFNLVITHEKKDIK